MCLVGSIYITDRSHIEMDHSKIGSIFQDGVTKSVADKKADHTMESDTASPQRTHSEISCLSGVSGLQELQSLHLQY